MCATEDGRRLYVFGGFDGSQLLNDVYYCEAERGIWSPVTVGGQAPEPREGHTAAIIGKYLLVGGACDDIRGADVLWAVCFGLGGFALGAFRFWAHCGCGLRFPAGGCPGPLWPDMAVLWWCWE